MHLSEERNASRSRLTCDLFIAKKHAFMAKKKVFLQRETNVK